jgi:predicted amidophosphoribosyltransferase
MKSLEQLTRNPPAKACYQCWHVWYNAQRVCGYCGYEFYQKREKLIDNNPKRD